MAGVAPFDEADRAEIKRVARSVFNGHGIPYEMEGDAKRWATMIQAFLTSVDRENGSLLHLPYSGGILEQPYKTMMLFGLLQSIFLEEIEKANKRSMRSGKR